eukprot:gene17561-biopygen3391
MRPDGKRAFRPCAKPASRTRPRLRPVWPAAPLPKGAIRDSPPASGHGKERRSDTCAERICNSTTSDIPLPALKVPFERLRSGAVDVPQRMALSAAATAQGSGREGLQQPAGARGESPQPEPALASASAQPGRLASSPAAPPPHGGAAGGSPAEAELMGAQPPRRVAPAAQPTGNGHNGREACRALPARASMQREPAARAPTNQPAAGGGREREGRGGEREEAGWLPRLTQTGSAAEWRRMSSGAVGAERYVRGPLRNGRQARLAAGAGGFGLLALRKVGTPVCHRVAFEFEFPAIIIVEMEHSTGGPRASLPASRPAICGPGIASLCS